MALSNPYQLKTFADLYTAVREELKIQSTDTTSIQRIQRDINIIYLDEVVPFANWRWLRGNLNLNIYQAFTSGTATVTQGSSQVTLTVAPSASKQRFYFSTLGYNEIYRISQHTAGSTALYLESPYTGPTSTTATFQIWTDEIPLPAFVRETFGVYHDFQDVPLENCGLTKFRTYVAALPKAQGRPQFYTTDDYVDPGNFQSVAGLPAITTRQSATLQKQINFAADVTPYLATGDRIKIVLSGDQTYNGEYIVTGTNTAGASSGYITYTGIYPLQESAISDATMSLTKAYGQQVERRYKRLLVYPSINDQNMMLHVDFLREITPLVNDSDEPLMPIGDRAVILYGALHRAWSRERNPEEAKRNYDLYQTKLARMAGKVDDSIEPPRLQINKVYLGAKRAAQRQRDSYGFPGGWGSTGSVAGGGSTPQNTANRVAIWDTSGNLNATGWAYSFGGNSGVTYQFAFTPTANRVITWPDASDTVCFIATQQTLTNKNLSDATVVAVNSADTSKQMNWSLAGATTATATTLAFAQTANRTITFPDATDTVALIATQQNLTNKDLIDASVVVANSSDNTKQVKWSLGGATTGTVTTQTYVQTANRTITWPDASDTVCLIATQQNLSNKVLLDGSVWHGNTADSTKTLKFSLGSATTGTATTFSLAQTTNRTITFQDATDTVVMQATADTLTNKTFGDGPIFTEIATPSNPAASSLKLYPKSDGNFYSLNSSGVETLIGSGGSGSGKDYLSQYNGNTGNGDFELNSTTGWSLFNTTLTSGIPTGAISAGASSVGTFQTVSSGQLAGKYSLDTASAAAWSAGQGFISNAFTIDTEDQAKIMQVRFYYQVVSGAANCNFSGTSSNTFAVYIYDVTNSAWIQPAGVYNLVQNSGVGQCLATFQTTSNSTQYRVAVLAVNASSGATTMYWDDFFCGPQLAPSAPTVGDTNNNLTFTFSAGFGTVSNASVFSRRHGDRLEVQGLAQAGTVAASVGYIQLPAGLSIDYTKVSNNATGCVVGAITNVYQSTARNPYASGDAAYLFVDGSTTSQIFVAATTGSNALTKSNANGLLGSSNYFEFNFSIPITGWSSNTVSSADTDTRVCSCEASAKLPTGTISGSLSAAKFPSVDKDTHAGYSVSTGLYTAQISGFYAVSAIIEVSHASVSVNGSLGIAFQVNGTTNYCPNFTKFQSTSVVDYSVSTSGVVYLNAGDSIGVVVSSSGTTPSYSNNTFGSSFSINRLSGPSVVQATENVHAKAYGSGTTVASGTTTTLIFGTVEYDSHGQYSTSTGKYTCPVAGVYECTCFFQASASSGTGAVNDLETLRLQKNGGSDLTIGFFTAQTTTALTRSINGTGQFKCVAGDTLNFAINNPDSAFSGANSQGGTWCTFKRIGN